MPIEFGIWRVENGKTTPVTTSALAKEEELEEILEQDPSILGLDVLLIIGRQIINSYGTRLDLLAIDSEGALYIIEVKKGRTPREVVAQALDYGYWVNDLEIQQVAEIYAKHHAGEDFEAAFRERFDAQPPEELNEEHHLVIVASSIDPSTERIVRYVRGRGVPIYVVFFQYFKDGQSEYLARTWDEDPEIDDGKPKTPKAKTTKPPWNGQDFYISFGEGEHRNWDDAVKYGFISGGGGKWYSQSLQALFPGARIFACIPKTGYVGVGTVKETAQPVRDFKVTVDGQEMPILEAPIKTPKMARIGEDDEQTEYLVRVDWVVTRSREEAIWEKGMFANQNTAVRLRHPFTIEKLTEAFSLDGGEGEKPGPLTDDATL